MASKICEVIKNVHWNIVIFVRIFENRKPYFLGAPLFNFEALRFSAFWREVLPEKRRLIENRKIYSYEFSKVCHCLFPNNSK